MSTVWNALLTGEAPVKRPFTYPKIASASSVMPTDTGSAVRAPSAM